MYVCVCNDIYFFYDIFEFTENAVCCCALRYVLHTSLGIISYQLRITSIVAINESNEREFVVTVHKNMNVAISGFNS